MLVLVIMLALFGGLDQRVSSCGVAGVQVFGSLSELMHEGRTESRIALAELDLSDGAVAVGALAGLRGEVTLVEGRLYLSVPEGAGSRTLVGAATDEGAALLVYAAVPAWQQVPVPKDVALPELAGFVEASAIAAGLDVERPFPFVVEGEFAQVQFHTIDARRAVDGEAADHAALAIREERPRARGRLVGFYSKAHAGVFTHHGSRIHAHVVLETPLASGHLDGVEVLAGAVLKLPSPEMPGQGRR